MIIKTIDLWTEKCDNHYECFNGAFVDWFENGKKPFDEYKIVKNCNCIIDTNGEFDVNNKHNAIIFYKGKKPVRLMVINKNTDIRKCIDVALNEEFENIPLKDRYEYLKIKEKVIDLKEKPILREYEKEIDVASCDRWNLLYSMLKGNYTEFDSKYGNYETNKYYFIPKLSIKFDLKIEDELYCIEHKCGFVNMLKTRIIPIQENSRLTL